MAEPKKPEHVFWPLPSGPARPVQCRHPSPEGDSPLTLDRRVLPHGITHRRSEELEDLRKRKYVCVSGFASEGSEDKKSVGVQRIACWVIPQKASVKIARAIVANHNPSITHNWTAQYIELYRESSIVSTAARIPGEYWSSTCSNPVAYPAQANDLAEVIHVRSCHSRCESGHMGQQIERPHAGRVGR